MRRHQLVVLLALVCVGALPSELCAQESPARSAAPVPPESNLKQARAHFTLGLGFFNAHNYVEALREFQLVAELTPSADIWFNIGRSYEELGEYDKALEALARYLRDRVDAPDEADVRARMRDIARRAQLQHEREQSAPDRGSLRIHGARDRALVFVDGRRVPPAELREPLLLPAGRHRLDVVEPQRVPLHAEVEIAPGLLTAAYAAPPPLTYAHTLPASHGVSTALLALSGAGLATAAVFGGFELAHQGQGGLPAARTWAVRTDVALAGTAVCALLTALVYAIEARDAPTELSQPALH